MTLKNNLLKPIFYVGFVFVSSVVMASNPGCTEDTIRKALEYQRLNYPASQYRDVYKNFMQDYFGPGHILNDTTATGKYLRYELSTTENFDGPDFEPTGFQGNFYRVNIKFLKDNTIPYDVFFDAFVESVQGIVPPEPEEWMKTWSLIDSQIKAIGWKFENEEEDRKQLSEQFKEGDFIVHHSDNYNNSVNFHYRIISKDRFDKIIRPYIEASKHKD